MKKYFIYLMFLFWGCNLSSTAHFLHPEYAGSRRFSTTILIMPLTPYYLEPHVWDSLSTAQQIELIRPGNQEITYFNNYFGPLVSEYSTADVIGIDPFFRTHGIAFRQDNLLFEDNTALQMLVPDSGHISYRSRVPDFVLFTQDLIFEKDFVEERNGIGEGTTSKYTMVASIKYLFWDNHRNRVAGYGRLQNRRQMMDYPGKSTYLDVLDEFVREMVDNSPLVRRRIRQ